MDISRRHRVNIRQHERSPHTWSSRIVLASITALALSVAFWATAASALEEPRTFSLLEVDATEAPLGDFTFDRAPAPGDQFTETNVLYRWTGAKSKGARVGHDRVLLTFVTGFGAKFTHRAVILANGQIYLPDGTLMAVGYGNIPPDGPHRFTLPIVGGTGIYANARGYMTTQGLGNGHTPRTKLDFHLVP
jgi:hypothetical protein